MRQKKSKSSSKKAPANVAEVAVAIDHYPNSAKAFESLIMVFVHAQAVCRAGQKLREEVQAVKAARLDLLYHPKPTDDMDAEWRESLTARRAEMPSGLMRMTGIADTYFQSERELRMHIEAAKLDADRAAPELDSPETPPLRRTSIAIRRALRNLSGSVPNPMTAGWAAITGDGVVETIVKLANRVSVWIEELRLLVRPRHTMPPPLLLMSRTPESSLRTVATSESRRASQRASGTTTRRLSRDQRRNKAAKKGDVSELASLLTDLQIETLDALKRVDAHDRNSRRSASYLAKRMNDRDEKTLDHPMATLAALRLTESQGGRDGGSWITTLGDAVLRARGGGQR